jgi:hypothetical protein
VEELLRTVGREAESQVQSALRGFFGGMVRSYLPQVWVFVTEDGVASMTIAPDGKVTVTPGAAATPDVTVEASHDRLRAALSSRGRAPGVPGMLKATAHTPKGRAAFDLMRGRLGL